MEYGIYLVDAAKGTILYTAHVKSKDGACGNLGLTLMDNWMVYHYYEGVDPADGDAKGQRLVVVELYEGEGPDEKIGRCVVSLTV